MSLRLRVFILCAVAMFFINIYRKYINNKLSFNNFLGGAVFSILSVLSVFLYDSILVFVNWLGIHELSNLIYFILFGFILLNLIGINSRIHRQEERIRFLIQEESLKNDTEAYKK